MDLIEYLQRFFESLQRFFMTSPADPRGIAQSLWFIIALPLLGSAVCGIFGRALGRANVNLIACTAVAGSFVLSLLAFWAVNDFNTQAPPLPGMDGVRYALGHDYGAWFSAGSFQARFGLWVDHLSGTMLLVVTGVGFLIHLYSTSYMGHDPGYGRYFAYLNLFVASMLTLVLADNLVLTFVGWEGVGLCSYLLIGFWYTDAAKAWAGRKAFIVNRIGDCALTIGMLLLVLWVGAFQSQARSNLAGGTGERLGQGISLTGPLNYRALESVAKALPAQALSPRVSAQTPIQQGPLSGHTYGEVLTAILLMFLLGAAGKSAQIPLYVWLPDAMAGPTPVSALIHAATMVTAGVYLFCRVSYLLVFSPWAMAAVALVGAATALWAALIAFAQNDIKKVLAYSTVSQLGFMFMAAGLGVFWAAILHLVTHAFFKACLFLGAGSVMHGNAEETNIHKLGGLRRQMPWTWATFLIATLAITGIVPLAGFFSKDAILQGVRESRLAALPWVNDAVWRMGLLAAAGTAFYMARLYLLTFEGRRAADAKAPPAHESDWPMVSVLVVLAGLSVIGLLYGLPLVRVGEGREVVMENFLAPVFHTARRTLLSSGVVEPVEGGSLLGAWALAWGIALAGGGVAAFFYLLVFPARAGRRAPAPLAAIRRVVQNNFYVDALYDFAVVRPIRFLSLVLYRVVDEFLIDRLAVRGTAWVTARTGTVLRYFQTGDVQSYAAVMALAVLCGVAYFLFGVK